ncbi:MBL fold metallo-hydrolase [Plesiomonas sp.]|uniref:MBL fold metallo-hydrolase n=1 Tax=Plesiomonas sp. TaxID=2486279 RepID=UPI003F320AE2
MSSINGLASNQGSYEIVVIESGRANFLNYMFIIYDEKTGDAVVIDPGWDALFIINYLNDHLLTCRGIFVTHTHADHVHAADEISMALDCPIFMSHQEVTVSGYTQANLITFSENTLIKCGSVVCHTLLTPGHTSGTSCFLIGHRLFTGDTLFIEGCGLCSGPDGSVNQMFTSLQFLLATIPDDVLVYPGHMYTEPLGQPFGKIKERNAYLRITNQKMFEFFCGRPARNQHKPPAFNTATVLNTKVVSFS